LRREKRLRAELKLFGGAAEVNALDDGGIALLRGLHFRGIELGGTVRDLHGYGKLFARFRGKLRLVVGNLHAITAGGQHGGPDLGVGIDNDIPALGASDGDE
jgi:hypothetical protein